MLGSFSLPAQVKEKMPAPVAQKAPPEVEQALRERVTQFYTYFKEGKFRRAEGLVAEESKDRFYNMSKVPIEGFKIENVEFDDYFRTANVLVSCLARTPRATGLGMYLPVTGKWKLLDSSWFLVIEPRSTTPFGPIGARSDSEQEGRRTARLSPPPDRASTIQAVVKGAFSLDTQKLTFPRSGPTVVRTVTITNNLPGPLSMTIEGADFPGMHLMINDTRIPPKSQMFFQLKYNPQEGKHTESRQIAVRIQPLNQTRTIQLEFE